MRDVVRQKNDARIVFLRSLIYKSTVVALKQLIKILNIKHMDVEL